tara:strand:- start:2290 stop:2679 length:390 start_codon:yes stop_codon:yes gene_type:complete
MLFDSLFLLSTAFAITFCNVKDCYEIEEHIVEQKVEECLYQAQMNMLVLDWKKRNNWKQVEWIGGNKQLNCMPVIPNMFLLGNETEKQLQFLDELRCRLHNMKRDPVLYQIYFYDICMATFNPEKHTTK